MLPFIPLVEQIKRDIIDGKILTPKGDKYESISAYNYKNAIRWLRSFEESHGIIYLEDIDIEWAEDFQMFLMDNDLSKNTISSILIRVKAVLRRLFDKGLTSFNGVGIRTAGEQTTAIFTSSDELEYLANLDLSDRPGLARIRDIYYLHCHLGLRFSDFKLILKNPEAYLTKTNGRSFFTVRTKKTDTPVVIPIGRKAGDILGKCEFDFGASFSYQHYNNFLKEMGKAAGLTENVIFSRTQGGRRVDVSVPKYELLSSHTARRSFATNAHLAGVDTISIMQITGHSSEASFRKYVRCSSLASAIKIADHSFFN